MLNIVLKAASLLVLAHFSANAGKLQIYTDSLEEAYRRTFVTPAQNLAEFSNAPPLENVEDGVYKRTFSSAPTLACLEGSNVDTVTELLQLIETQRLFGLI